MAVPVTPGATFVVGSPTLLFLGDYVTAAAMRGAYDVSADGQRFLMIKHADGRGMQAPHIIVVQNWVDELKRLVPAN